MKIRHVLVGCVALGAAVTGAAPALAAPAAHPSSVAVAAATRSVCAQDLYVRETAQGVVIGTLFKGDNFAVSRYSPSGAYAYGHAYGNVHKDGWVQTAGLC